MEVMENREVWWLNLELLPLNPHGKAGNEKKREIEFWWPLETDYPFKSLNNQVVDSIFNQQVIRENFLSSDVSKVRTKHFDVDLI